MSLLAAALTFALLGCALVLYVRSSGHFDIDDGLCIRLSYQFDMCISEDEAFDTAAKGICPGNPDQVRDQLHGYPNDSLPFWHVFVEGQGEDIEFIVSENENFHPVFAPANDASTAYVDSRGPACQAARLYWNSSRLDRWTELH